MLRNKRNVDKLYVPQKVALVRQKVITHKALMMKATSLV